MADLSEANVIKHRSELKPKQVTSQNSTSNPPENSPLPSLVAILRHEN